MTQPTPEEDQQSAEQAMIEWASEWADKFDQGWDPDRLSEMVGKTVRGQTADEQHGFEKTVVGYTRDVLVIEGREVYRSSFITSDGTAVPIFAEMRIVVKKPE